MIDLYEKVDFAAKVFTVEKEDGTFQLEEHVLLDLCEYYSDRQYFIGEDEIENKSGEIESVFILEERINWTGKREKIEEFATEVEAVHACNLLKLWDLEKGRDDNPRYFHDKEKALELLDELTHH